MPEHYPASVETYSVPVRGPHPLAVMIASRLGRITGRGIDGHTGTIRYGEGGGLQTQRTSFTGYVKAPQLFLGASRSGGRPRVPTPALSSSHLPAGASLGSPLSAAMAAVTAARGGNVTGDDDGSRGHG